MECSMRLLGWHRQPSGIDEVYRGSIDSPILSRHNALKARSGTLPARLARGNYLIYVISPTF